MQRDVQEAVLMYARQLRHPRGIILPPREGARVLGHPRERERVVMDKGSGAG